MNESDLSIRWDQWLSGWKRGGNVVRASDWNTVLFEGYDMTGSRHPIGGELETPCIWCGQEYREVKFRWNDERRVGCSKCGAPKG